MVYGYGCTNVAVTGKGTLMPQMDVWKVWFIPATSWRMSRGSRRSSRRWTDSEKLGAQLPNEAVMWYNTEDFISYHP